MEMLLTARELADYLGATLEGDGSAPVSGLASPEGAGPEDFISVDAGKHLARAAASRACCVLVALEAELPTKTLLRTPHPKLDFARAAARLVPEPPLAAGVHPTAVIDPTAELGRGVAVGPFAVIEAGAAVGAGTQIAAFCFLGRGARTGRDCRLHPRATLYAGAQLGDRVTLHAGAVVGSDGFGYVFADGRYHKFPQVGRIRIGDDVEIGANTTLDRGALDETSIGEGTKIDNLVHIAHNVIVGRHVVMAAQTGISGSCRLGDRVVCGGQVGLCDHVTLEEGAVVGAGSAVLTGKRVRAGEVVWGVPARPLDRSKLYNAWYARLPELAERIARLEQSAGKHPERPRR
jgi:UDP-3-O-[3-hydroxymyristoyl] glucosamine N-acyltransferase